MVESGLLPPGLTAAVGGDDGGVAVGLDGTTVVSSCLGTTDDGRGPRGAWRGNW